MNACSGHLTFEHAFKNLNLLTKFFFSVPENEFPGETIVENWEAYYLLGALSLS